MRMKIALDIALDLIEAIPGKQSFIRTDPVHIATTERYMAIFDELPPIYIQRVDGRHFLADGYHRCEAAQRLGRKSIKAIVLDITGEPVSDYNVLISQPWTKLQGAPHA